MRFCKVENGIQRLGARVYDNMKEEYYHSKGVGRITGKILRRVDLLTTPIKKLDGTVTNLRGFITSVIDAPLGKPLFNSIKPAPTKGNKNSVLVVLTSYRSRSHQRTLEIANRAKEYITNKLALDVWASFGHDEAKKVIAATICKDLEMDNAVSIEDVTRDDDKFVGMDFLLRMTTWNWKKFRPIWRGTSPYELLSQPGIAL